MDKHKDVEVASHQVFDKERKEEFAETEFQKVGSVKLSLSLDDISLNSHNS